MKERKLCSIDVNVSNVVAAAWWSLDRDRRVWTMTYASVGGGGGVSSAPGVRALCSRWRRRSGGRHLDAAAVRADARPSGNVVDYDGLR